MNDPGSGTSPSPACNDCILAGNLMETSERFGARGPSKAAP
jgi:hypothetical protein